MTIQAHFSRGNERIVIRIIGDNVLFIDLKTNQMSPIEGLSLNRLGVEKEHPDLKDDKNWKQKAIQRFVDKIKSFKTEEEKMKFMISEMSEMGYKIMYTQKNGFRPKKYQED